MNTVFRTLGYRIRFPDTSVKGLLKNKGKILDLTDQHGCICLENINITPQQQLQFTSGIFQTIISLPKQLAFNNQDPVYKSVTRVGNVLLDGTLKDSSKEATYWHQDGEFWCNQGKHLFNFLHVREIPKKGGDTWIMDMVKGAKFMKQKKTQIYNKMKQIVGEINFDQIGDFALYGKPKLDIEIPSIAQHNLVRPFNKYGYKQVLYLSVDYFREKSTGKLYTGFTRQSLNEILMEEMGFYRHEWKEGDMLIWDNWQVSHRSSGQFQGRRLLYRTQGQKTYN